MSQKNYIKKSFLIALAATTVFTTPVFAKNAVLSGIEISSNPDSSYRLLIQTDQEVPIIKHINANNKLTLDISNVTPAKFVNTVYENTSNIENVIVQPISDSQVRVLVQGNNIANGEVVLSTNQSIEPVKVEATAVKTPETSNSKKAIESFEDTASTQTEEPYTETLKITPKYRSFNNENQLKNLEEPQQNVLRNIAVSIRKQINKSNFDWMLRILTLAMFIFAGKKLFGDKPQTVKINLNENEKLKDKELDLLKSLNKRQGLVGTGLKDNSTMPQGYSSVAKYGLNEYKNSEYPKYYSSVGQKVDPYLKERFNRNENLLNQPLRQAPILNNPPVKRKTIVKNEQINAVKAKDNLNNIKFLEAMAQIYEKSGRQDLAQGLKNNIKKAKTQNIA